MDLNEHFSVVTHSENFDGIDKNTCCNNLMVNLSGDWYCQKYYQSIGFKENGYERAMLFCNAYYTYHNCYIDSIKKPVEKETSNEYDKEFEEEYKDIQSKEKTKDVFRKIGRAISVVFAVLATLMVFNINRHDPAGIITIFILAFVNLVPFLVIFKAARYSKVMKGVFLCIGIGISALVIVIYKESEIPGIINLAIGLGILNFISCITAIIFPKES